MEEESKAAGQGFDVQRCLLLGLFLLVVAFLFTAFSLNVSREIGRLSSVSNYDDVVYLNKASIVYYTAERQGLGAAAKWLFTENLHAPFAVFAALGGFWIFGPDLDRVYYALALVVFVFLAFVVAAARKLPPILQVSVTLASLGLPYATMCAQQFRPDMMWATVLGGACVLFLGAEHPFSRRGPSIAYGVALAVVLLTKPSTFAMTFLVMGGTWLLVALNAWVCRRAIPAEIGRGALATAGAALVVAGWYCIPHGREIFNYFYSNSFGEYKDIWSYQGDIWDQLTYYVRPTGVAVESNAGWFFFPLLGVFLVGAIRDVWRGDLFVKIQGGAFLWMFAGITAVNAAFGMKSPFLGGSFYGFVIFGAVWYGAQLLLAEIERGWLRPAWKEALCGCGILIASAGMHTFPRACKISRPRGRMQVEANRGVVADLLRTSGKKSSPRIVFTQGNPIVPEYLQMEFREQNRELQGVSAAFLRNADAVKQLAASSNYILLQDQQIFGSPGAAIPGEKLQPELLAYFRNDPGWTLISRYPDKLGRAVYLFKRLPPSKK